MSAKSRIRTARPKDRRLLDALAQNARMADLTRIPRLQVLGRKERQPVLEDAQFRSCISTLR